MRILFPCSIALLFPVFVYAQTPNWVWVRQSIGDGSEQFEKVIADHSGHLYATGYFDGDTIFFGSDTLINSYPGTPDLFVVKYDTLGNAMWARSAGNSDFDFAHDIVCDASDNIYITGTYTYYPITFGSFTLANAGQSDVFLVKYDSSGNVIWARSAGGTADDGGMALAIDNTDHIYLTGSFSSSLITFGINSVPNSGGSDVFIVKYDTAGNCNWVSASGSSGNEYGMDITVGAQYRVYVTGRFLGAQFIYGNDTLNNNGSQTGDIFLIRLDSAGYYLNAVSAGGSEDDAGVALLCDTASNILLTGTYKSPAIGFGSSSIVNGNWGFNDIFLASFDTLFNLNWLNSAGGISEDNVSDMAVDASGNILLAGYFKGAAANFGSVTLQSFNLTYYDLFIVCYNSLGSSLWGKKAGGNSNEFSNGVAADASGNIFTVGSFWSNAVDFNSEVLNNSATGADALIIKLDNMTGMNEMVDESGFSLYPDPCHDHAVIHLTHSIKEGILNVYNSTGQLVFSVNGLSGDLIALDDLSQPDGIYFFTITSSGRPETNGRFVILHSN